MTSSFVFLHIWKRHGRGNLHLILSFNIYQEGNKIGNFILRHYVEGKEMQKQNKIRGIIGLLSIITRNFVVADHQNHSLGVQSNWNGTFL